MKHEIEVTKIERTDVNDDNSAYEFKTPVKIKDDFGNDIIQYKKETILCRDFDKSIDEKISELQGEIDALIRKKLSVNDIK